MVRPRTGGVGLDSMHERTRQLGGWLTVDTDPSGTRVDFAAPLYSRSSS